MPLGILCAMAQEMEHLARDLDGAGRVQGGKGYRRGRLDGIEVVLAECGIGKVASSVAATLLVERFGCGALLVSGVAGGVDPALGIGDVVIADRLVQHDYGAIVGETIRNFRPGVPPLGPARDALHCDLDPDLRRRLDRALAGLALAAMPANVAGGRTPILSFGTIATGDQFVGCDATRRRLHERHGARAVDMESAAVAQVAEHFGLPWVVVRSLSDLAGSDSHIDFTAFIDAAAKNAASVVRRVLPALAG